MADLLALFGRNGSRKTPVLRLFSCVVCVLCLVPAKAQLRSVTFEPIQYPSVVIAMETLLARKDVLIDVQSGWSIITERSGLIWTFAPIDHPSYPTVMRQRVSYKQDGSVSVDMAVLCETQKMPCQEVITLLRQRNQRTAEQLKFSARDNAFLEQSAPQQP